MKTTILTIIAALLLIVPFAAAGNMETNTFYDAATGAPVTNVQMSVYQCADNNEQCVTVLQPAAINANSGASSTLTVEYPGTATPRDYAEYFYAAGYIPMEFVVPNDYGTGQSYNYITRFEKAQNCRAPVENFVMTNSVYANEPLVVNLRAMLDSTTYSAFNDAGVPPYFVPEAYKAEYYSALTDVTLNIYNPLGQLVYTETQQVNLYMNTAQSVRFTWVPASQGSGYRAEIVTNVVDNQCASNVPVSTAQQFVVLPERVRNECYVLLDNLATSDQFPEAGQELDISYTKISNYANNNYEKTAVPMTANYMIREGQNDPSGTIVNDGGASLPATSTGVPAEFGFEWTPSEAGWYTIYVDGQSNSPLCAAVPNNAENISLQVYVGEPMSNDVIVTVTDLRTGNFVAGAAVTSNGKTNITNANGVATLQDFTPGTYEYSVSEASYQTFTGSFQMGIVNVYIDVQLSADNAAPQIVLDDIDPLVLQTGTTTTIDFRQFISDDDNSMSQLVLTLEESGAVPASINNLNKFVTFVAPAAPVTTNFTFTVTDPSGAMGSDTLTVRVVSDNEAPTISGLPDVTLNEDSQRLDAFNLRNFASDRETLRDQLTFSISAGVNPCGVTLDPFMNIDVQPGRDVSGTCSVLVTVYDGAGLTATDTFVVTVTALNDAPVIDSTPSARATAGVQYIYSAQAYDADGDVLTFSLQAAPAGMAVNSDTGRVTWTPTLAQVGSQTVTLGVTDGQATDLQTYVIEVGSDTNSTPNTAPVITSTPNTIAEENLLYTYDVNAFDSDVGDTVAYSLEEAPEDMTINSLNGFITWTPEERGNYTVKVRATDSFGAFDEQEYTLQVMVEGSGVPPTPGTERYDELTLERVRVVSGEIVQPGDIIRLVVDATNSGTRDLEDVKLSVYIYDWAMWRSIGPFDIDEDEQLVRTLTFEVPEDAVPGDVDIRVVASNDELTRVIHRVVTVV